MVRRISNLIKSLLRKRKTPNIRPPELPLKGFLESMNAIPYVDYLTDEDLQELNSLLQWKAFVADNKGRRFGNMAWNGKRTLPQTIPDVRHKILNERFSLHDKKVLEIGCFEGIHTISLCQLAREVIAIDSRMENVLKTIVRCNLFNKKPTVFKCDVETWDVPIDWLQANVCHHIGVLYHLIDPIKHLYKLATLIDEAIFLDTHIASPSDQLEEYTVDGKSYKYKRYLESGVRDVFSGMYDHAKWLRLKDLKEVLQDCGFRNIEVIEERVERNGARVLLLARK